MSQQKTDISSSAIKTFSSLFGGRGSTVNSKTQNTTNQRPDDAGKQPQQTSQNPPKSQTKVQVTMPNSPTQSTAMQQSTTNPPRPKTVSQTSTSGNQSKLNQPNPQTPETKLVDVVISGVTYPIQCPADEVSSLQKASDFINQFISDIRKQAPTLSHENLLVLCCLNLYEQIDSQQAQHKHHQLENERVQALIKKISQDAQSILPH